MNNLFPAREKRRQFFDKLSRRAMRLLTVASASLIFIIAGGLVWRSWPILSAIPLADLIVSSEWQPLRGVFGFGPFLAGTLWVTAIAVLIAVPLCLLTAVYLSEYAGRRTREFTAPLIDLLAGIPSVIYGIWGILVIVPLIRDFMAPLFNAQTTGYSVLAGGVVLAVMIFPVIIHVTMEVLRAVPREMRESSLSVGATRWQTTKHVVLRRALPGVIAAIILGLSRAFGETMAVLMVAGNVARVPLSVFDPAYPLPALIANNYGEMLSIPLYDSALLLAALILLLVVILFNILSRLILVRAQRRAV
jgi:phosphate transport system permease protein